MIAVRDLSFAYSPRSAPIINNLTYDFPPGSVTTVTGPSGYGKSTLLYVLGLLLSPTGGSVLIDGTNTRGLSDAAWSALRARRIGFVFQDALLDPARTIVDNVTEGVVYAGIPASQARARACELLTELGVDHRFDHRPGQISGGQAQRVALCRALIKQPAVLLADEPSGNLDHESADLVWDILRRTAETGATVIVATHDRSRVAGNRLDLTAP